MQVLVHLVNSGSLSASGFVDICATQLLRQEPIGRIALRNGFLNMRQVFQIVELQSADTRPFGELAVELGFLTRERVQSLLLEQQLQKRSLQSIALELQLVSEEQLTAARQAVSRGRVSLEMELADCPRPDTKRGRKKKQPRVATLEISV